MLVADCALLLAYHSPTRVTAMPLDVGSALVQAAREVELGKRVPRALAAECPLEDYYSGAYSADVCRGSFMAFYYLFLANCRVRYKHASTATVLPL